MDSDVCQQIRFKNKFRHEMGENKAKDRQELNSLLQFDLKRRWRKILEKLNTKIPQTLAVIIWVLLGWRWEKIRQKIGRN